MLSGREKNETYTIASDTAGIAWRAFAGNPYLKSVTIPDNVKFIGNGAFEKCCNLKTVKLSSLLREISTVVFWGCDLESIEIPDSVKKIGYNAFKDCHNLKNVKLPKDVIIEHDAFANTPFGEKLKQQETAQQIQTRGKGSNSEVRITEREIVRSAQNRDFSEKQKTQEKEKTANPDQIDFEQIERDKKSGIQFSEDGKKLIRFPKNDTRLSYAIPWGITTIAEEAFERTNLKNIMIPDTVTKIGKRAFAGCSMEKVIIPKYIEKIEDYAFHNLPHLKEVVLPDGLKKIPDGMFTHSSSLDTVNIPDTVEYIGNSAFWACHKLSDIHIPDRVRTIGRDAFGGCRSLKRLHIPAGVQFMKGNPFSNMPDLVLTLDKQNRHFVMDDGVLFDRERERLFYYPVSKKDVNYTVPSSVIQIENRAFASNSNIVNVKLPNGVLSFAQGAFSNCTALAKINIPNSVTSLDSYVFSNCISLKKIFLPDSLRFIGSQQTFDGCISLMEVRLPSKISYIPSWCFRKCSSLKMISLPPNLKSISRAAFAESGLEHVAIPASVKVISAEAFLKCSDLKTVKLPFHVTLGVDVFKDTPAVLKKY